MDSLFAGRRIWIMSGTTERGIVPVGMACGIMPTPPIVAFFPYFIWFPEATVRHKLEATARFCDTVGRMQPILTIVDETDAKLFRRLERYTKVREIGQVKGYFGSKDAWAFQTDVLADLSPRHHPGRKFSS